MNRPGYRLRAVAARWCSERTMERLVDPAIADLQTEYAEAARAGRVWRSRWIWIAGHAAFAKAMAWHGAERAAGSLRDLPVEDRRALLRTIAIGVAMMVAATVLLAALPFVSIRSGTFSQRVWSTPNTVLQLLPTTIWVGVIFGILWGLESVSVSRHSRRLVLLLALALSVVSFTLMGWLVPAANHAFRVSMATKLGVEVKGLRSASDLTLGDLGRLLEPGTHEPMLLAPPHDVRSLERSYYTRWAYSCAPLVLGLFALTLSNRSRWARRAPGFVASALVLGYVALWYAAQAMAFDRRVPIAAAVWIPNAVVLVLWLMQVRRGTGARLQAR